MKLAVLRERRNREHRVAATPDTVKKFLGLGLSVCVEAGAGEGASIPDQQYREAGAQISTSAAETLRDADIILKVQRPLLPGEGEDELAAMPKGAILIGMLAPYAGREGLEAYAEAGLTAFSMELVPRITRAQSMDVLSSQSNLAGYKAVIDAAATFGRAFPMMMTAAGTIAPARVMVLGAGVAGLQAIATARRLGAIVSATDVRPAAREQVESLGGKFVMVDSDETAQAETAGGYAREMSEDYKRRQAELVAETLRKQDIAICTALIPGRRAPTLIDDEMVRSMAPGSVIVDLAAEQGGNCTMTEPGQVVVKQGVTIIGHENVPSRLPVDASALYAKNLLNFVSLLIDRERQALSIDTEDEIIAQTLLTRDGAVVHPRFQE